jgi:hypothetical protein
VTSADDAADADDSLASAALSAAATRSAALPGAVDVVINRTLVRGRLGVQGEASENACCFLNTRLPA